MIWKCDDTCAIAYCRLFCIKISCAARCGLQVMRQMVRFMLVKAQEPPDHLIIAAARTSNNAILGFEILLYDIARYACCLRLANGLKGDMVAVVSFGCADLVSERRCACLN